MGAESTETRVTQNGDHVTSASSLALESPQDTQGGDASSTSPQQDQAKRKSSASYAKRSEYSREFPKVEWILTKGWRFYLSFSFLLPFLMVLIGCTL